MLKIKASFIFVSGVEMSKNDVFKINWFRNFFICIFCIAEAILIRSKIIV